MPRNVYYAMAPQALNSYVEHKNDMQAASKIVTAEKIEQIKAAVDSFKSGDQPKNYRVEDRIARIGITGVLEAKMDFCAVLFDIDMTTYSDIINSIKLAENDNSVDEIIFEINSPGGNVVGLSRTAEKIKNAKKPTTAIVTDMAASAAYWLASQADKIIAEHSAVEVGSIGVYCEHISITERDKLCGIERKSFRSANAPMKNADPFTAKGEKQVVERITNIESVFFDYISSGRHTSIDNIKENYGKGALLIAGDALDIGMIDAIETIGKLDTPIQQKNINTKQENKIVSEKIEMTQEQFDSAISKAASSAATQALSTQASGNEKKLVEEKKESDRVAGFTSLLASFSNQKEMIKTEIASGNHATADFAMKVSDAEKTRAKVALENSENEDDTAPDIKVVDDKNTNTEANAIAEMCVKGRV